MKFSDYEPEPSCQIPGLQGILAGLFGTDKTTGTFVEVGAFDGRTYSNTYQLAQAGWRGVYIEPLPDFYDRCLGNHKDHPNIRVVNKFVSNYTGSVQMYRSANGIDSGDADFIKSINDIDWTKTVSVAVDTLPNILTQLGFDDQLDLLVIDVEGHESAVLEGMFGGYMARHYHLSIFDIHASVIIVEAHRYHADARYRARVRDIDDIMAINQYRRIYSDSINDIYVAV